MRPLPLACAALAVAATLLPGPRAGALERCKVKVDPRDGTLLVSARGAAGPLLWGPSAAGATRPFANAASCLVGATAKACVLGDPGTAARITPPPLCTLHLSDGSGTCAAYLRGCVPGARGDVEDAAGLAARVDVLEEHARKRVFVTSDTFPSTFGSLAAADFLCQGAADAAGLGGSFRAWLSEDSANPERSPARRFARSRSPYVRIDGVVVADDWIDLTDGTLQNPIDVTETGGAPSVNFVWTATDFLGDIVGTLADCGNWANPSNNSAVFGNPTRTDAGWTTNVETICLAVLPLYCFEQ